MFVCFLVSANALAKVAAPALRSRKKVYQEKYGSESLAYMHNVWTDQCLAQSHSHSSPLPYTTQVDVSQKMWAALTDCANPAGRGCLGNSPQSPAR